MSKAMNIYKASDINISIGPSRKILLIYTFLITMKLFSSISLLLILSLSYLTVYKFTRFLNSCFFR